MNYREFKYQLCNLNSEYLSIGYGLVPSLSADFINGKIELTHLTLSDVSREVANINLQCTGCVELYLPQDYLPFGDYAASLANLCMKFSMTPLKDRFTNSKEQ